MTGCTTANMAYCQSVRIRRHIRVQRRCAAVTFCRGPGLEGWRNRRHVPVARPGAGCLTNRINPSRQSRTMGPDGRQPNRGFDAVLNVQLARRTSKVGSVEQVRQTWISIPTFRILIFWMYRRFLLPTPIPISPHCANVRPSIAIPMVHSSLRDMTIAFPSIGTPQFGPRTRRPTSHRNSAGPRHCTSTTPRSYSLTRRITPAYENFWELYR